MYHLGFEIHRLSKLMHRELQHSAAHQHADRMTGVSYADISAHPSP